MAPSGTEVIVGSVNDPTFGPTIMFGLGGIFVEVLKDVTFRVAPVNKSQIEQMLTEIRGAPMLKGVRGELPRDARLWWMFSISMPSWFLIWRTMSRKRMPTQFLSTRKARVSRLWMQGSS